MNPTKNRTYLIASVLALVALVAFVPITPTHAQGPSAVSQMDRFIAGEGVLRGYAAVSTSPQILLQYTGTNANGGTVAVSAGGDITFSQGPVGSSAVDATMECDASIAASGSRNGIYDLSTPDTACDTLGEVVDKINSQGTNWLAVIVNGLRSDAVDNVFITLSETAAVNTIDGLGILADGTTLFKQYVAVIPSLAQTSITFYKAAGATGRNSRTLKENPFAGLTTTFYSLTGTSTYGSGTSAQVLYCVKVANRVSTAGSEAVTSYSKAAGATTVEATFAPQANWGVACPVGQKAIAGTINSAAMSAAATYVAGHVY